MPATWDDSDTETDKEEEIVNVVCLMEQENTEVKSYNSKTDLLSDNDSVEYEECDMFSGEEVFAQMEKNYTKYLSIKKKSKGLISELEVLKTKNAKLKEE
jgi:hypothetical protein